jgi:hypothetical protein
MSRVRTRALGALLALVIVRLAIVVTWHKPGGDGIQYLALANHLRDDNTLAFVDGQPAYSRLPGYPLFLAYLVAPGHSKSLGYHLRSATIANVVLDLLSALLLWLAARRLGLRRAWAAGLAFLLLPTLWLMSCYAMTETLSTALVAAELHLAVRLLADPRLRVALAAGAVAGFAQLVRLDAICALPMIAYACLRAPTSARRRAGLLAAFAAAALVVFAPWPLRNLARFGKPHFAASTSRTVSGQPFGDGIYNWARTWSDSAVGDSYFELYFVYEYPYDTKRPNAIPAKSYDSPEERARIVAATQRYTADGLTDQVEADFSALARDRLRRHPWRTLVVLPLKRLGHLFAGEPKYDMPMVVRWLGLPHWRPLFGVFDLALTLLALAGAVLAWRGRRALFWLTVPAIVLRLGIYAFAVPHATTHRFLVEAFPLFLILAAAGIEQVTRRPA